MSKTRKSVTIRDDQAEWIARTGRDLSQFVQEKLDEEMDPTNEELRVAYAENAEQARETNREWDPASKEATERLGEPPETEDPE